MIYLHKTGTLQNDFEESQEEVRAERIHHLSRSTGPSLIRQPMWLSFSFVYDTSMSVFLFYTVRRTETK